MSKNNPSKSTEPSKLAEEQVKKSFLGNWILQASALVAVVTAYLTAIKLFGTELDFILKQHDTLTWIVLSLPFVIVLVCNILPTLIRKHRDKNLRILAIEGTLKYPRYFRVRPFETEDRDEYYRADGADHDVTQWIQKQSQPLLYLTGFSGTGKSSLLQASVMPSLEEHGWVTLMARSFANPAQTISNALYKENAVWVRPPNKADNLREQLIQACSYLRSKNKQLLIVLDQFEEFLILHEKHEQRDFSQSLSDLVTTPIDGLTLLLVIRSDYITLVRKNGLPALHDRENWLELGKYTYTMAKEFFKNSELELSQELIEQMLRGLSEIEETPNMYRLIGLNMLGLVLSESPEQLSLSPARLIPHYVKTKLSDPEISPYAYSVLRPMISEAGTKHPRSISNLVENSGLDAWRVEGTLKRLSLAGLVRPLDSEFRYWEVAHDFLAALIGQQLGNLHRPLWGIVNRNATPILIFLWIGLFFGGLVYWKNTADTLLKALAHDNGFTITVNSNNCYELKANLSVDNRNLTAFFVGYYDIACLDIDLSITGISDLTALSGLTSLQKLRLNGTDVNDLTGLSGLTSLQELDLSDTDVNDLTDLSGLKSLQKLRLNGTNVNDLTGLSGLKSLQILYLARTDVIDLTGLSGLTSLQELYLSSTNDKVLTSLSGLMSPQMYYPYGTNIVRDLAGPPELASLQELNLNRANVIDLTGLSGLTSLQTLYLIGTDVSDLTALSGLTSLQTLYLIGTDVIDLTALSGLTSLQELSLSSSDVSDLTALSGLTSLQELDLSDTDVSDLTALSGLTSLQELDLRNTKVIDLTDLSGLTSLQSLDLRFTKVSDLTGLAELKSLKIKSFLRAR